MNIVGIFFIALFAALAITAVAIFAIVRSYSMKYKPVDYPFDQFTKLNLQEQSDLLVDKQVTSRVISDGSRKR